MGGSAKRVPRVEVEEKFEEAQELIYEFRIPQKRRSEFNLQYDFKSKRSNDFSLRFLDEQSEIIHFDSAINLMSSQNFKVENLASKEKISLGNFSSMKQLTTPVQGKPKREKKEKSRNKGGQGKKNFNKNLLILKKSMEYITKFEDSEGEEDAEAVDEEQPEREVETVSYHQRKLEITTSNSKGILKKKKAVEMEKKREELGEWIQSKCEVSSSGKVKHQIISVYSKTKEFENTKKKFYQKPIESESSPKKEKLSKHLKRVSSLDEKMMEEGTKPKNLKRAISTKVTLGKRKARRRYSAFDKLSSKKFREKAIRENLKRREEEEMKECTFAPTINKLSKMICSFKEAESGKQKRGRNVN